MAKQTKKKPVIMAIEKYLKDNYSFRYNLVTNRLEYKPKEATSFELVSAFILNSIYRDLTIQGFKTHIGTLRNILNSNFTPTYDPFKAYFKRLPKWDGKTDYIEQLASTVSTTNDALWKQCFKKWLVAMTASLLEPKAINHTVIVFSGAQGLGKTSWMLKLVPNQLEEYVFSGTINPGNKDTLIHISETMLVNLDELESLNKSQIGELKELITKNVVRVRKAYGVHAENLIRRASFAGSVNDMQFLNDTTGNRRFLCFEVSDIKYQHNINIDHVFAQALHLFKSGFQHWFDDKEIKLISTNNEQFQAMTMEEELLLAYYEPCSQIDATDFLSATEVAAVLSEYKRFQISNGTKQNLGRALNKHKFLRLKKKGRYVYALSRTNQHSNNQPSSIQIDLNNLN